MGFLHILQLYCYCYYFLFFYFFHFIYLFIIYLFIYIIYLFISKLINRLMNYCSARAWQTVDWLGSWASATTATSSSTNSSVASTSQAIDRASTASRVVLSRRSLALTVLAARHVRRVATHHSFGSHRNALSVLVSSSSSSSSLATLPSTASVSLRKSFLTLDDDSLWRVVIDALKWFVCLFSFSFLF